MCNQLKGATELSARINFKYLQWLQQTKCDNNRSNPVKGVENSFISINSRDVSNPNLIPVPLTSCMKSADHKIKTPKACVGTWNADSIKPKTSSITDFIIEQKLDILAITESWLNGDGRDDLVLADLKYTLPHFNIYHVPRTERKGGGVFLLAHSGLNVKQNDTHQFSSFEYMDSTVHCGSSSVRLLTIYRPPPSKENKLTPKMFFKDFSTLLESVSIYQGNVLMLGDFNFHVDVPDDYNASKFLDLLDSAGLQQHVQNATHKKGHTLDLMISRKSSHFVSDLSVKMGLPSDHYAVKCNINISRPPPVKITIRSRNLRRINIDNLKSDIQASVLSADPSQDLSQFVDQYDTVLRNLLDEHAPEKDRSVTLRQNAQGYSDTLRDKKREKRRCERKWLKSKLEVDKQLYTEQCNKYRRMLDQAKCDYHRSQIAGCDDRQLFKLVDRLSKPFNAPALPDHKCKKDLANDFSGFFHGKVRKLRDTLDNLKCTDLSVEIHESANSSFASFSHVSTDEVQKIIIKSANKSGALDPVPTDLLKKCLDPVLPHITRIINMSLNTGSVPETLKVAQVVPLIKTPKLDRNELKNYRPISNVKFISKTIERAASAQLATYLQDNGLHGQKQSAYRQFHSKETALLRVQNDLLRAVDKHQEAVLIFVRLFRGV